MIFSKLIFLVLVGCGTTEKKDTGDTQPPVDTSDTQDTSDTGEEIIDGDGDGYTNDVDCDDDNPFAYPGAAENESSDDCMSDRDEDGQFLYLAIFQVYKDHSTVRCSKQARIPDRSWPY